MTASNEFEVLPEIYRVKLGDSMTTDQITAGLGEPFNSTSRFHRQTSLSSKQRRNGKTKFNSSSPSQDLPTKKGSGS